ncbi:tRNA pseudouridine synthase 1 [Gaertneriomyces sp. JEL0708]|nr:tRNA pseudouridine synthase 1 [Gaertneriomyces sp. JEL0708]
MSNTKDLVETMDTEAVDTGFGNKRALDVVADGLSESPPPAEKKFKCDDNDDFAVVEKAVDLKIQNDSLQEVSNLEGTGQNADRGKSAKRGKQRGNPKSNRKNKDWTPRAKQEGDSDDEGGRGKKRKVALLMGYNGTGYSGMQINPNVETIEKALHEALAKAGGVSKDNAYRPDKIAFMRAARTDKGVHAIGQVCSLKLRLTPTIVEDLNANLPPQIRVWGYIRTTNSFHAKNACDARIYEYFLPSYVLQDAEPKFWPYSPIGVTHGYDARAVNPEYASLPVKTPEQLAAWRAYRITPQKLSHLRECLRTYEGTHNYHNFTNGKQHNDKSSNRYIISFTAEDPVISNGLEWLKLTVIGQSFMLHQIRKMVGLVILMVRTNTSKTLIPQTWANIKVNIPKAPALGLLLERTIFRGYNQKWTCAEGISGGSFRSGASVEEVLRMCGKMPQGLDIADFQQKEQEEVHKGPGTEVSATPGLAATSTEAPTTPTANGSSESPNAKPPKQANPPATRLPIDFSAYDSVITAFKTQFIYDALQKTERDTAEFDNWVNLLDERSVDFSWFLADKIDPSRKPATEYRKEAPGNGSRDGNGQNISANVQDEDDLLGGQAGDE